MASTLYCPRCLNTFTDDPERCANLSCGHVRPKDGWGTLLHPGDVLDRHYQIVRALAVGGAGLTYRARELGSDGQPTGPDLAIKVLYAQRDQGSFLRRLSNEAQILQELNHDNIVKCHGFVTRTGHAPYLVTLFERGGSLGGHLERHGALPPPVAAGILRQVLLALDTAHQRAIVHRDLKPENVLLCEAVDRDTIPRVRVADFGIAKVQAIGDQLTKLGAFVGTPEYAAPEQFEGKAPTPATDVYAAGALLWALLTNEGPVAFSNRMDVETCYDELVAQVPPRVPDSVATGAEQELLQLVFDGTMQVQPERRFTVQQVLVALDGLVDGTARQTLRTLELTDHPADRRTWEGEARASAPTPPSPPPRDRTATLVGIGAPLVVLVLGTPLVALLLGVTAFATGWFEPAPTVQDAVERPVLVLPALPDVPARDLSRSTDPQDLAERDRLTATLTRMAGDLREKCDLTDALIADVRISPRGRVREVRVQGSHPDGQVQCVRRTLSQARLARATDDDVVMRISLSFGR